MSDTHIIPASTTRFMREAPVPALTPALEAAILGRLAKSTGPLAEIRSAAYAALRKIGLPHSGSEEFSFIRVNEFLPHLAAADGSASEASMSNARPSLSEIEASIFPESRSSYVVMVDGEYAPGLSKPGSDYQVTSLEKALESDLAAGQHTLRESLIRMALEEIDAAAAIAQIFSGKPLLVRLAEKAAPKKPLQILNYSTGKTSGEAARKDSWIVFQGQKLSEGRVLVRHAGAADVVASGSTSDSTAASVAGAPSPSAASSTPAQPAATLFNLHRSLILDEAASLKWLEAAPSSTEENRDIHFQKLFAHVSRDARLVVVSASTGTRLTRNTFAVDLLGEGAEAEINGAAVLAGAQQNHNFVHVRHLFPHGNSRQHFKTVAADFSKSSVDGTIYVALDAQATNAYQLINNLMLSDNARTDSKPRLMIHADDVKCAHGATAGKLDPAQQFYLESRGLDPVQAKTLMTVAFIAEVLDKASGPDKTATAGFRAHVDHALLDTLRAKTGSNPAAAPSGNAGVTSAPHPGAVNRNSGEGE